jgi:hypothetical protein
VWYSYCGGIPPYFYFLKGKLRELTVTYGIPVTSVADPDPHVFGPPGSGSGSTRQRMDPDPAPDPSIIMQNSKKNLGSYYFVQCGGSGMFIPDPFLPIPDPGSRIPDPKEQQKRGVKKN